MRSWFPPSDSKLGPRTAQAWASLEPRHKVWMVAWLLWLLVPALAGYVVLTRQQTQHRLAAVARHAARMDPTKNDAVATPLVLTPPKGHENDPPAVQVDTGIYLTRIPKYSIVEAMWHADFYVWFSWRGGEGINPGETFKIVSGEITNKTLMRRTDEGDRHYALYRVNAEITKSFDVSRFPRDEHVLTIVLEDQGLQYHQMVYTTNPQLSEISSRVDMTGYAIVRKEAIVKPHTYKTSMGDPSLPPDHRATYSDFVMAITVTRPAWGVFWKMFLPLYLAMMLALVALFVVGPAERLGLVSTALFVAVINGWTINAMIPDTGTTTLADVISFVGYTVIGQAIIQTILYGRYIPDRSTHENLATVFDRITFAVLTVAAVLINLGLVRAASG